MEERKPNQQPIDLSALEGLTLGTAWSPSSTSSDRSERTPKRDFGSRPPRRFDNDRGPRTPGQPGQRPQGGQGNSRPPFRSDRRDDRRENRPAPIQPPSVKVTFYPEEAPFKALTKAIKASKRTYELFEIARLVVEKPERTIATITNLTQGEGKPAPLFQVIADESIYLTEAEALAAATKSALPKFFNIEEVEVEAPKGNFVVLHKCGITGELIAPPNYHRYAALLAEHQAAHLPNMTVAAIQARLESVKEPEAIAQWIERMKKTTRYTLLAVKEGETAQSFDSADAAIAHLATNHRSALIKSVAQARLTSKQIEALPTGELKRSIEAARAMQTKFPLETANNLRGRLRRIGFNLYKRGQKGISYLCVVKRKFRAPGQAFAPEVQRVIEFIEKTANITDVELPKQLLGINPPVAPKHNPLAEDTQPAAPVVAALSAEESTALAQLRQTLQWLVEQGYVTHFGNGILFVPPARLPNAPKDPSEEEESAEAATETAEATEAESAELTPEAPAAAPAEATEKKPATPPQAYLPFQI